MHAGNRRTLWTELWIWIPAGIEKHEDRPDMMVAEIERKRSIRFWNVDESWSHNRLCRNTRMVFMPSCSAHPNSRSISPGSNVSACHISSSFTAFDGTKLAPTRNG